MRIALAILVIAAAVGGGWMLFRGDDNGRSGDRAPNNDTSQTGDASDSREPKDPVTTARDRDPHGRPVTTQRFTEPSLEPEESILVEFYSVDPNNREQRPVPGVDGWFLPNDEKTRRAASLKGIARGSIDTVVKALGTLYRADAEGRTRVPSGPIDSTVLGLAPGLMGLGSHRQVRDGVLRIRMRPTGRVSARVLDSEDRPVSGITVGLLRGDDRTIGIGRSDEKGLAELMFQLEELRPEHGNPKLSLQIALADPFHREIDVDDLPTEPVVLRMPPTGEVVVKADAPPGDTAVTLRPAGEAHDPRRGDRLGHAVFVDGVARFEHVGLGKRFDLEASSSSGLKASKRDVLGPGAPGEKVEVALEFTATSPILVFRVVDEQREPRGKLAIGYTIRYESGTSSSSVSTDENGVARIQLRGQRRQVGRRMLEVYVDNGRGKGDRSEAGQFDITRDFPVGETDLGDVVLKPAPLIAGGLVVDGRGDPVEGARLDIQLLRSRDMWFVSRIRGSFETDSEGRFEIRSLNRPEGRHRIRANKAGYFLVDPVEFALGTAGLRLVLREGGTVVATIITPDGDRDQGLRVNLYPENGDGNRAYGAGFADGEWVWTALPPGSYRLNVSARGSAQSLADIGGIQVRAGAVTEDARLSPLDLRDRLRTLTVTVVDKDGAPIRGALVWIKYGRSGSGDRTDKRGMIRANVMRDATDLSVVVEERGYQKRTITEITDNMRITLERAPTVVVRVPAAVVSTVGSHRLRVQLRRLREDGARGFAEVVSGKVGKDGTARIVLPMPGRYAVHWSVTVRTNDAAIPISGPQGRKPDEIVVDARDRDRVVPLDMDAGKVRDLIEAAKKRR